MRKEFSAWVETFGKSEERCIFLTGDLGYLALENVQSSLGKRFVNMGVAEQNMVSVAAGLAQQGLLPICYSIAPFAVFRPYEQIRLDVAVHGLAVKIVGNGGGYGYGIMGASHHALEDLAVLSCLPNFLCMVPLCNSDVDAACEALFRHSGPGYLRLGFGEWPKEIAPLPPFEAVRRLSVRRDRVRLTVVGIGPVLLNALPWILADEGIDLFAISQLPLSNVDAGFIESVQSSGQVLVLEEHAQRGGLGEYIAAMLGRVGVHFRLYHRHAMGYPNQRYGSQAYHQMQSGLDASSIKTLVAEISSAAKHT
jgi:transketolase